jgi:hypothetical protein
VVGNFGISKVLELRGQIDAAQTQKNVLTQKLDILQNVNSTLGTAPDLATSALPAGNPSLLTISQLKTLAITNGIILTGIKAGTEIADPSGLSRNDVSFEATGTREQVLAFLKGINTFAPINVVDTIKMNEQSGLTKATTTVKSFWSPLPTKLPSVTQAISDLTPDERVILSSVTSLTQPTFLALPPANTAGKTDPFSP